MDHCVILHLLRSDWSNTSLSKYMEKYIKPMSNRNKITCGFKTCISDMLLQSDINKWRISQWSKLYKLYINSTSTNILERSNNDCIEYKKLISPNDSHIRDYFTSQITRSSVLWYWNCNLVQIFQFLKRQLLSWTGFPIDWYKQTGKNTERVKK